MIQLYKKRNKAKAMSKIKEVYNKMKAEKENEVDDEVISMPKDDYVEEHIHLIKVLRSGDRKELEAEAKKQEKEMEEKVGKIKEEEEDD